MNKSWRLFRQGKIASRETIEFEYFLEDNLGWLQADLASGSYRHGGYRQFEVTDNKRRIIKVAAIRDRVVHRLIYEYLKPIFDQTFIYDAWSCRKGKGLIGAIKRTQEFLRQKPAGFVWRSDVKKFFDNVDREILFGLIARKIVDYKAIGIIKEIIFSEAIPMRERERESKSGRGIPIGNLASQIFANIYLNELDRFVKHNLRIKRYLRYGDDFIILSDNLSDLEEIKRKTSNFLSNNLRLEINARSDIIIKANRGLRFLGAVINPYDRRLNKRNNRRLRRRINLTNLSSYSGLISQYKKDKINEIDWLAVELLNEL